jgi:hypothetical protein
MKIVDLLYCSNRSLFTKALNITALLLYIKEEDDEEIESYFIKGTPMKNWLFLEMDKAFTAAATKRGEQPYSFLNKYLQRNESNSQIGSLTVITRMLHCAPDPEAFLEILAKNNINKLLQEQLRTIHKQSHLSLLHTYQVCLHTKHNLSYYFLYRPSVCKR